MAYTRTWSEVRPDGATTPANQIDSELQYVRVDFRERLGDLFGMSAADFTADPVVPRKVNLVHGAVTTDVNTLSATVTWNNVAVTFTAIKLNVTDTTSAAASKLVDLQVAAASKFSVTKAGVGAFAGALSIVGALSGVTSLAMGGALTGATTGAFSSNVTVGGTLGVTGAATFSSTVGTGALTVTGAATVSTTLSVTGAVTGGTYNGQTISAAASFTGSVAIATTLAVTGAATIGGTLGVTGQITGNLTGNAATATALQTARLINGVSFNGTADITVTAAAGTLTGATLNATVTASSLTSVGTLTSLTTGAITSNTTNNVLTASTATTNAKYIRIANTSGDVYLGTESSIGGGFFTGATAYATVLYSISQPIEVITSAGKLATFGTGFTIHTGTTALQATTATSLTVTGQITASGGVLISGNGSFAAGIIRKEPTDGFQLVGITGASNDFTIATPSGLYIARVPTGTQNVVFAGGITVTGTTAVQALTATSGTFSGIVTQTSATGYAFMWGGTGVNVHGWYADASGVYLRNNTSADAVRLTVSNAGHFTIAQNLTVSGITGVQALTATAATVTAASGYLFVGNINAAASLHGLYQLQRQGVGKAGIGLNASDAFTVFSSAGDLNLQITEAGAGTFRAGITATTGTFSGLIQASYANATVDINATSGVPSLSFSAGGTARAYWQSGSADNISMLGSGGTVAGTLTIAALTATTGAFSGAVTASTFGGVTMSAGAVSGVTTLAGSGAVSGFTTAAFSGAVTTTIVYSSTGAPGSIANGGTFDITIATNDRTYIVVVTGLDGGALSTGACFARYDSGLNQVIVSTLAANSFGFAGVAASTTLRVTNNSGGALTVKWSILGVVPE